MSNSAPASKHGGTSSIRIPIPRCSCILYEEKGPAMLHDLNGQFGLAFWDTRKKEFFLARDRMGIRPLFYKLDGPRITFASEIKAIFADPTIQRTLDPTTLSDVFTCWTPIGDLTPFEEIHQVMAGHYAVIHAEGMKTQRYWQIPFGRAAGQWAAVFRMAGRTERPPPGCLPHPAQGRCAGRGLSQRRSGQHLYELPCQKIISTINFAPSR